ncbi:MAG: dependent oxidoreductase, partial [Firmicutes bacterium]|nr:dependent oxidoreductase [Bacillota bacterium]
FHPAQITNQMDVRQAACAAQRTRRTQSKGVAQMTNVIVIGGGIVGASAAYRLARAQVNVTLVDRSDPGQATAAGSGPTP